MIEKKTWRQVKCLRIDNGLEFCYDEFNTLCKKERIVRHRTVCHTLQHNGVVERMNRTLMEKVRCMLSNAQLSMFFWVEVVSTECYLINHSPLVTIEKKTPQEVWFGSPANYSVKCMVLRYKSGVKGYKL